MDFFISLAIIRSQRLMNYDWETRNLDNYKLYTYSSSFETFLTFQMSKMNEGFLF